MGFAAAAPFILSGISALSGLFSNRSKTTTQQSSNQEDIDISELPLYDPKLALFRDKLINMFLSRAEDVPDFLERFKASGLSDINMASDVLSRNAENIATSRGLSRTSAGASSLVIPELSRLIEQNRFLSQVPLIGEELMSNRLQQAGSFLGSLPTGTRRVGGTTSQGTITQRGSGNMLGGGFSSLGTTLAGLIGAGAFGNKSSGGGGSLIPGGAWSRIGVG